MIWSIYNEKLVRRGEIFVEQYILGNWSKELSVMNKGKVGKPFEYADTFMTLLAYIRYLFSLPYRQTEGFVRALSFHTRSKAPDYSIINRRINALKVSIMARRRKGKVTIAVDSTGIKVTNRGDWLKRKWNKEKRKGYLKIHFAIDPKTKQVVSMDVTKEDVHDGTRLKKLVKKSNDAGARVDKVIADGAYDGKDNFRFLSSNGIEPAIKVRKNSSMHARGCYARKIVAVKQFEDFKAWKDSVSYGSRWIVESVFSCMKRTFGEYVRAKKFPNMVREMVIKTSMYNMLLSM